VFVEVSSHTDKTSLVFLGIWIFALSGSAALGQSDSGWGTIHGQVVFAGSLVPAPKAIDVNKDQDHCLAKGPIYSDELVVNPVNRGVRWAFVWLAPETKSSPPLAIHPSLKEIKEKQLSVDQPHCMFEPHALALREGQEVVFKNSAPINHNVHWTGHPLKNPGGNRIVSPGQSLNVENLKADRFPILVTCDIHGWMKGYLRVFDHPYFAVTDQDGKFEIKLAPAGKCRLVVWQDLGWVTPRVDGGEPGMPMTIKDGDNNIGKIEMKLPQKK
jgi:plastocyanin